MAVFQGARVRGTALPAAGVDDVRARVAVPAAHPPRPRVRPMGLLMATIVAATLLGLVYLTQTLGSNATTSEIWKLEQDRAKLQSQINRHAIQVLQSSDSDSVRTQARRLKLKKLDEPLVLSAP